MSDREHNSPSAAGAGHTGPDDPLLRFVERFALVLAESGMQRMAARVFAFMLAADANRHTAGDLARGLRVSPAAISAAVRYLGQAQLIVREREPGSRSDHYRLPGDVWSETYTQRLGQLGSWRREVERGLDELPGAGAGAARLRESRAFLSFLEGELPRMIERWQRHRRRLQASGGRPSRSRRSAAST